MKIKDILKVKGSKVWMIKETQTIHDALHLLVSRKIGALLVSDETSRNIVGILSERDIVRGLYEKKAKTEALLVKDLMTKKVLMGSPDDEIGSIMQLMTEKRVRHIPVMHNGVLLGIVSIGDVVKSLLQDSEHQIRHLKDYLYGPSASAI